MEITPQPRRRGRTRASRAALAAGAVLLTALLIPPAMGLSTHVASDGAMGGTHAQGALVFDKDVSWMRLDVGDVVSVVPPDADPDGGTVVRRIVAIEDDVIRTGSDTTGATDPWRLPLTDAGVSRVEFAVPWAGWPVLLLTALSIPPWAPALVLLLALGVLLRRSARPVMHAAARTPVTRSLG